MSVRRLLVAHVLAPPVPTDAFTLTSGRLWSLMGAALGVAGVVIGGLTLARSTGRLAKRGPVLALVSGLVGAGLGALVVAGAEGGPGTGGGIVGGYLALVIGLVAALLGGLATTRSRRPV